MEWLSSTKAPALPRAVLRFDPAFVSLIKESLLVCDVKKRKQLAQCMSAPYMISAENEKKERTSVAESANKVEMEDDAKTVARKIRTRGEDQSSIPPLHKGTLWK